MTETHEHGWKPPKGKDIAVRSWMEKRGTPVTSAHYDFLRKIYAWRHDDSRPTQTIHITRPLLEDFEADEIIGFLNAAGVSGLISNNPDAYTLIRRLGSGMMVQQLDDPQSRTEGPIP